MILEVEDVIDLLYRKQDDVAQEDFRQWLQKRKLALLAHRRRDGCAC